MSPREPIERRQKRDRRIKDNDLTPGREERRKIPERRHPDVEQIEFDEHVEVTSIIDGSVANRG